MLEKLIRAYLEGVGFTSYVSESGVEYWGHRELGGGRTFEDALKWWMGVEKERVRQGYPGTCSWNSTHPCKPREESRVS